MINNIGISIWDRRFYLPVEYDCYNGEQVTCEQIEAVKCFLSQEELIAKAKREVEAFCQDQVMADVENEKKDNVFSYIMPECIFVKRDIGHPRIALMCRYRYDPEHGLAVVFSSNGDVVVGSQDIIL